MKDNRDSYRPLPCLRSKVEVLPFCLLLAPFLLLSLNFDRTQYVLMIGVEQAMGF